jgi:hypothetical protein
VKSCEEDKLPESRTIADVTGWKNIEGIRKLSLQMDQQYKRAIDAAGPTGPKISEELPRCAVAAFASL